MSALGMPLLPPVSKMSAPSPCPTGASTALICKEPTDTRVRLGARSSESHVTRADAHLALDGAEHGRVHLLAHEAAGQQAPDHVELMRSKESEKTCVSTARHAKKAAPRSRRIFAFERTPWVHGGEAKQARTEQSRH